MLPKNLRIMKVTDSKGVDWIVAGVLIFKEHLLLIKNVFSMKRLSDFEKEQSYWLLVKLQIKLSRLLSGQRLNNFYHQSKRKKTC